MSEAVIIVLISSMGGTLLTVAGAIIQQGMAAKAAAQHASVQKAEHKEAKEVTDEIRQEHRDSFDDLKAILTRQQTILDNQTHINRVILRDRLRFLLKQHQDKDTVSYADKEDIDAMYKIYSDDGQNGTIKAMYDEFNKKKII